MVTSATVPTVEAVRTYADHDTPEWSAHTARALDYVLRLHGRGAGQWLADQLSDTTGEDITSSMITHWRNGRTHLTPTMVARIAQAYRMPLEPWYVSGNAGHLEPAKWLLEHNSDEFRCTRSASL